MFIGSYEHTFDAKGRVSVPSKFRTGAEGEKFFVTRGTTEKCLFVYPKEQWDAMCDKLNALPIVTNKKNSEFVRRFTANAGECDVDKLGRINVAEDLRKYAGISKSVKIVGVRDRFEIWDLEYWNEKYGYEEDSFEDMQAVMDEIDFEF